MSKIRYMNREEIEAKVRDFLIDDLEIDEDKIFPDARLKGDMGIDIVVIVERIFGFKIKAEDMAGIDTFAKFCDYIESKLG